MHPYRKDAKDSKVKKLSRMYADGGTVRDKLKATADAVANSTAIMGKAVNNTSSAVNTELAKPEKPRDK